MTNVDTGWHPWGHLHTEGQSSPELRMRKQGCVHPVPSSPVLRPVLFYFRAVHSAQDVLISRAGNWLLISWPPPHPPPPTAGLPVPHNGVTAGNFKLVASVHTAISICFSAFSSTNRASQPVPARQAIPRWGPIVVAGRAGTRWSNTGQWCRKCRSRHPCLNLYLRL